MNNVRERREMSFGASPKRNYLMLMVAFFFLLGCLCLPYTQGGAWLWALTAAGAALTVTLKLGGRRCSAGIVLLCFSLGLMHAHAAFDITAPAEGSYFITGYVYGEATPRTDDRISFILGDIALDGTSVSGKAYCTLHYDDEAGAPALFDGAKVTFEGRVYHPDGKSGEPRMDFRLWMRQKGYAFGVAAYQDIFIENTAADAPVKDAVYRTHQLFAAAFERSMGENSRIAMALLFGQRSGLTEEEYQDFQTLGIAHILSVSGLHVGLLGAMLFALLERLRMKKQPQLIILCIFLLLYCLLTGFSAAAIRAAAMLVSMALAKLCKRRGDRLTTLAFAMLIVLIIDPLSALSAGFVLSFSAMLGIILCSRPILEQIDRLCPDIDPGRNKKSLRALASRMLRDAKALLAVSAAAQLGVMLPTMRYFQQLPLYGLFINLLIVPLVTAVLVPLYIAVLGLSVIPVLAAPVGWAASVMTDVLLWLVKLLSGLPYAAIRTGAPPVILCIGFAAAAILLARRTPGHFGKKLTAAVLCIAVAFGGWFVARPADLRYIQLAEGQADAALLFDGDTTVVIDTGADGEGVIDYLMYENRSIDALILTHLHLDHSGGVKALLESGIRIRQVYLPAQAHTQKLDEDALAVWQTLLDSGIPLSTLASGDELRYNRSSLRVLWPERDTLRTGQPANDYPLVLSIDLDGFTLLNASDLSGKYERYATVPADVLKVSHHGSSDSTRDAFLDFVSPKYALLSVTGSSKSLPSEETLARLNEHGASILRTDECGDITLSVRNGQLFITPYQERNRP